MNDIKFEKKVFLEIIAMAVPLMLTNVLQQLYNTSDAIIVGKGIGDLALSAVGASSYIILVLTYLFIGLTVGASINISQAYGAKDYEKISKLVHSGIGVSIISGLFLTVVGYFGAGLFFKLSNVPSEVYPLAVDYLKIYFCGVIFSMLYNMGSAILRGTGNTKISLYCLMASTITNIVLDLVFVFYFKWGIKSVAIATISSQFVSCLIILYTLIKREDACKLNIKKIRLLPQETKEIVCIGIPSGAQSVVQSFSNLYVQSKIYFFGATVLAGVTAYTRVEGFFYMIIEGVAVSMGVIAGQLYGKRETKKIPTYLIASIIICFIAIIPLSIIFFVFDEQIISLLIKNPDSIKEGVKMLRIIVPLYMVYGVSQILSNVVKGLGRTRQSMRIVLIFTCGFRVLWVTLVMILYKNTSLLYYVYPASWLLTAFVFYINYKILKQKNFLEKYIALK